MTTSISKHFIGMGDRVSFRGDEGEPLEGMVYDKRFRQKSGGGWDVTLVIFCAGVPYLRGMRQVKRL